MFFMVLFIYVFISVANVFETMPLGEIFGEAGGSCKSNSQVMVRKEGIIGSASAHHHFQKALFTEWHLKHSFTLSKKKNKPFSPKWTIRLKSRRVLVSLQMLKVSAPILQGGSSINVRDWVKLRNSLQ